MIVTRDQAVIRAGKNDQRVFRRRRNPSGLAATNIEPIAGANPKIGITAGDPNGRVVLLRAIDVIGKIIIERYAIELGRGLILFAPTSATIKRDISPAIVALNHPVRIFRSDPEIVIVAVRDADTSERAPTVIRFVKAGIQDINRIGVFWIGVD